MFSGYWRRPEETLAATRNLWYHTGDLGRIDSAGSLWFAARKKEFIRRRGENVSMLELETAFLAIDGVAEAAVAGVPSEVGDQDILACLVPRHGQRLDAATLFRQFAESLPYYAIPRYVKVARELPKNALGRVLRYELSAMPDETWDFESLGLVVSRDGRRA
jgi:crotonobetaine/carnitine-CoA ligase